MLFLIEKWYRVHPLDLQPSQCHCFMVFSELNFLLFFFFISRGKGNSKEECFLDFSQNSNSIIHLAFSLSLAHKCSRANIHKYTARAHADIHPAMLCVYWPSLLPMEDSEIKCTSTVCLCLHLY